MREDCDQFRIANGASPLVRHHKGHRSNNKDSCSKSRISTRVDNYRVIYWVSKKKGEVFEDKTIAASLIFEI